MKCLCDSLLTLGNKRTDVKLMTTILMGTLAYGVLYFQSRLLHSMCLKDGMVTCNGVKDIHNN